MAARSIRLREDFGVGLGEWGLGGSELVGRAASLRVRSAIAALVVSYSRLPSPPETT